MRIISLAIIILFSLNAFTQTAADFEKKYLDEGSKILTLINTKKAEEKNIKESIESMVLNAIGIMDLYAKKNPESTKLLDFLKKNVNNLKSMSFETLEKDWHDAAALTKDKVGLDLKNEDNEKYLDPCHIMIHPLMVLAAIKNKDLDSAKEELVEGMDQMKLTKKQVEYEIK